MPGLLLCLAALPLNCLLAQNFKTLRSFDGLADGGEPESGVVLIGNTLYGTTHYGGTWKEFGSTSGTVYGVNTDGTGFQVVFGFPLGSGGAQGGNPQGKFAISDGILYGTAFEYTSAYPYYGMLFSVSIDGTSEFLNNWFDFEPVFGDGSQPDGVIQSDTLLYGVTHSGGQFGHGTVYVYDGVTITNLYRFAGADGANPNGSLVLSTNGILYGVTFSGGSGGNGTVYALDSVGMGLRTLHHFTGSTNGEGANPKAGLLLSGNTLFGTTFAGGTSGNGTVFSVGIDGTGFTTLHSFTGVTEGANPSAALILSSNTLYGTTFHGGNAGSGTVFSVTIDGRVFSTLHTFNGSDGAFPAAELVISGNTLFGTTQLGGDWASGTVFSLLLTAAVPQQLSITPSGLNVVLTWPTNGASFLQSTTTLGSAPVWTRLFPGPVVVNGLNTVTNPISAAPQFFRLSQ